MFGISSSGHRMLELRKKNAKAKRQEFRVSKKESDEMQLSELRFYFQVPSFR